MPTGPGFPGFSNVFIPGTNRDVDGRLIVGFSRNAKRFALPNYVQMVKAPSSVGYYLKLTAQEAARVVNKQDFVWPDGRPRPSNEGTESFNFIEFRTERYDYGFRIGQKTVDHASWPIVEQHAQIKAAQCMTNRTVRVWDVLTTASSWQTSSDPDLATDHTATATSLGGGKWDVGTSTSPNIRSTINAVADIICKDTLGVVEGTPDQLVIVVNPTTARGMSKSPEIHDYLKGSPAAERVVLDGLTPNAKFGLPGSLYGYKVVVETAVRVSSRVGGTLSRTYVCPDDVALVLSVVGGLEGVYGAPSFSTVTCFHTEEMTVERFDDPKNRLVEGHVVEDMAEVLTAPASGFYITDVLS